MATFLEIPLDPAFAEFRQVCVLDGTPYVLEFSWSERSESWFLDLYLQTDTDPEPVSTGMRLSVGYPLLTGCVGDNRPLGDLVATGESDPGRLDLGRDVKLLYISP